MVTQTQQVAALRADLYLIWGLLSFMSKDTSPETAAEMTKADLQHLRSELVTIQRKAYDAEQKIAKMLQAF
jgi:hypothetical protein